MLLRLAYFRVRLFAWQNVCQVCVVVVESEGCLLRALPSSTRPALRTLCAPLLRRSLCAAAPPKDEGGAAAPPKDEGGTAGLPLPSFADEVLRGVGQVIFLNSPTSGAITLTIHGDGAEGVEGVPRNTNWTRTLQSSCSG